MAGKETATQATSKGKWNFPIYPGGICLFVCWMINTLFANSYPEYFFLFFHLFSNYSRVGISVYFPFCFSFLKEREFRASVHIGTG